jgi:hypothetical protein
VLTFRLGVNHLFRQEVEPARTLLEESLAGFRQLGMRTSEGEAIGSLGSLELTHGDPARGVALIEESIDIAREVGFMWWEAGKPGELSRYALERGQHEQGERWARDSLALFEQMRDLRIS